MALEPMSEIASRLELSIQSQESSTQNQKCLEPHNCAICNGTGFIPSANSHGYIECQCAIEKRATTRLPERFRQASFLDINASIHNFVLDWFKAPGDGLFISGKAGRGKTYLAAAIVRTLLFIHQEAFFIRCPDFYAALREAYRTNTSDHSVYGQYVNPNYVVLDDLGSGTLSDFQRAATTELLDQRINKQQRPTIVTSNWSLEQIAEKLDERIASRLSSFVSLELAGEDRRMRK